MDAKPTVNFLHEESNGGTDDNFQEGENSDTDEMTTSQRMDDDIEQSSDFVIDITENYANKLYSEAGTEECETNNVTVINPPPQLIALQEEQLILEAKKTGN